MDINVADYLSDGQMREIAIETWREMCREACKGNPERIIENIGHAVATQMVVDALGDDANEQIKAKAIDVIADLSVFSVFRKKDVWDRDETPAFKVLSEAVKANSDLVNEKVRECIGQMSKREALEIIKSGVIQITPVI